jgi:serine phosphatase RsbU (regulator of sigma subunit)
MEPRYRTPQELVEGLQGRGAGARAQMWQLLREPLERLMGELIARHELEEDRDLLTRHALHSAETTLRSRPASAFAGLSWRAFRSGVLLEMARLALHPHGGGSSAAPLGVPPLPESPAYQHRTFFRPYARLGNNLFGGDWVMGRHLEDGSLWVLLADVTGHGYYAYLLACGLPALWQRCWSSHPQPPSEPADLLATMHEVLADCMPEGIYLECTLVRLLHDGAATVVPAGGIRLYVRSGTGRPNLVKLRGAWLGLRAPTLDEQCTLALSQGDELLLATDGVFDQLEDEGGSDVVPEPTPEESLFDTVRELLERSLERGPQRDDITMVLVRRRAATEDVPAPVPFHGTAPGRLADVPSASKENGAGDVPV